MDQNYYHSSIEVPVSALNAFAGICAVPGWWCTNFNGNTDEKDGGFSVRFGETFVGFTVEEFIPFAKIVWKVTDSYLHWLINKTEWNGTRVVWEISPGGGPVKIDMTHSGLAPGMECYGNCREGWDFYVRKSLLQFLEKGKGMPETPGSDR